MSTNPGAPELLSVTPDQWEEARRRFAVIRGLAQRTPRTRKDVTSAASELGLCTAQVYRLLARYAANPRLTSLVPQPCGGVRRSSRIAPALHTLVAEALEHGHLTRHGAMS